MANSLRAPSAGLFVDQSHFAQHRQRRIDDARARRIGAAGAFLDGADQVVAVTGLVGDQFEQHEAQFAAVEHPPPAAAASETRAVFAPASRPFAVAKSAAARTGVMALETAAMAGRPRASRV